MKFMNGLGMFLFAGTPTVLLFVEYIRRGQVIWWLLLLTILCNIVVMALTYSNDDKASVG